MEKTKREIEVLKWMREFMMLYFSGKRDDAYKLKLKKIPKKLYKFQPYGEEYINTVLKNKLWFTMPKNFNDPYDSMGMTWDSHEMKKFYEEILSENRVRELGGSERIAKGNIDAIRDNIRISCFSEQLYNMPMWAHYADNHRGFCIEYNFSQRDIKNDLIEGLYPVIYEERKQDIDYLLKIGLISAIKETHDLKLNMLPLLMNIKHNSWKYEEEWRIIDSRDSNKEEFEDGLLDCNLKPARIYLGINFDKEKIDYVKAQFEEVGVPVYCLETNNSQFFTLKEERI